MKRAQKIALLALAMMLGAGVCGRFSHLFAQDSGRLELAEHFRAGQKALQQGRPDLAVQEFKDVLRLNPSLGPARINLGLAYHLLGDYQLAAENLRQGLEQQPNVLGGNIILGIDESKLGSPARAIAPLKRALRLDPSNQQALHTLAAAYLALDNYSKANRAYRIVFQNERKRADGWLHLGKAYLQMSSRLAARLAHNPQSASWKLRLNGDLLSVRQRPVDAAHAYEQALALDPAQPGLHAALGNAFLMQGKLPEAGREFQGEIERDAANPPALLGLAAINLEKGQAREALRAISKVAASSPQFLADQTDFPFVKLPPALATRLAAQVRSVPPEAGVHFLLASLDAAAGKTTQAQNERAAFQSRLKPQAPGASAANSCRNHEYALCIKLLQAKSHLSAAEYLKLGEAHFALRQYGPASDAFASAFARENDSETTYWLTRSYLKLAEFCFSQLTAAFPGSPQSHELEAETFRAQGADDRAIQEYQAAATLEPGKASLHEALGELYLKKHNIPAAEQELEKSLRIDPSRARSLYLMGRVDLGRKEPEKAITCLEKALHYEPDLLPARASLGMAYLHAGKPGLAVPQLERSASLDYYGDLHYMLYQAYRQLGKNELAQSALTESQALRRKTQARDAAVMRSAERK
ncbi:MAG TPA: tetratricopeptide repeat protein [Terriglobia bacterium]|nr:tetratricopeptide repeat protein [Terriglobia bacterium]